MRDTEMLMRKREEGCMSGRSGYQIARHWLMVLLVAAMPLAAQDDAQVQQFRDTGKCEECNLSYTDFSDLDFGTNRVNVERADLTGSILKGLTLKHANLDRTRLVDADLSDIQSNGLQLYVADMEGANLRNARLPGVNLTGADLTEADFTGAIFSFDGSADRTAMGSGVDLLTGVEATLCRTIMPDGTINNSGCPQ